MSKASRIIARLIAAALLPCASARGEGADRPIDLFDLGAPTFTNFSVRDGVPDSVVVSVRTARDGFVWLSSPQSLARYDGRRWDTSEPLALAGAGANADLMVDHEGTLWASFRERGIAQYERRGWRFESGVGAPRHVRRLTETIGVDGRPALWATTYDDGLYFRDGGRWKPAPDAGQLPHGVLSVAQTRMLGGHPRLWAGTFNEGLWFREDGDWQRLRTARFDPAQIEQLLVTIQDGHEELWISAFGGGLWRLDADGFHSWSAESGALPTNEIYDMALGHAPDGSNVIWTASRSGLLRVHHDRVEVFDRGHGLPSDVIRGLSVWHSPDGIEVLWLATEAGVSRAVIGASRWLTASLMGAQSIGVFGVLVEPDGDGGERLWVGSSGDGLGLYEHGQWRHYTQAAGQLPDADVRMIRRGTDDDGESVLWLGLRTGYLVRMRAGARFDTIRTPWELHPGQAVMDMVTRRSGGRIERWFATRQSGIWRWRDGQWTEFRPETAVGQWRIVGLLDQVDAAGRSWLWATSNQGLARFDGERWTLLGREAGLPDPALAGISLIPDREGRPILWIGTANSGIVRVDVGDPLHPRVLAADLPAAPDPTAYGAVRDSRGRVYVCTNAGVQVLTPGANGYASQVFTRRDGMVHEECNTNAQFVDAHDRFWTGTLGGLTVYDPARAIADRERKPLVLTDVRIDGRRVDDAALSLAEGRHTVHVGFALLSWQHENETRFRTRLRGYEPDAEEWTTQNSRDFHALPAGDYVLSVEGRDHAGNVSGPIELPISVVPAWWRTTAAHALFAVAALLALYGLLLWRTRSIEAQRRTLEDQVAERTAELNAANARLLELSYRDSLTGLANRRALLEALEAATREHDRAALIFVDVDHFKDYNDHFGHPAGDEALRCAARAMVESLPADALVSRYGGEEFACLLLDVDLDVAIALAERIRTAAALAQVPIAGTAILNRITLSAGVACRRLDGAGDVHQLLRDADNALYRAKNDGRDCVRW